MSFFFYAAQLLLYIVAPAVELSISPDAEHSRPENKRIPFAAAAVVFTSFSSFFVFFSGLSGFCLDGSNLYTTMGTDWIHGKNWGSTQLMPTNLS